MQNSYCYKCMAPIDSPSARCEVCGFNNEERGNGYGYLPEVILKDQYLIGRALGQGGFGITYLGRDLTLDRIVAIKEYFPRGLVTRREDGAVMPYPDCVEQFESGKRHAIKEAKAGISVGVVAHVVRVYTAFEANNTVYIVMDYVDGVTLASLVEERKRKNEAKKETSDVRQASPMTFNEVQMLFAPVFHAMQQIHARDLVHRDISPENIMIARADGQPVILDFGAARSTETPGSLSGSVCRPSYSPPEQTSAGTQFSAPDKRSDEYSLCATIYYALTGVQPDNATARMMEDALPPPSKLGSDIPHSSEEALMKGMAIKIDERYPNLNILEEELFGGTRRTQFEEALPRGTRQVQKKKSSALPVIMLALLALALALAGAGYLILKLRSENSDLKRDAADSYEQWEIESSDLNAQINELQSQADDKEAEIKNLNAQIDEYRTEMDSLQQTGTASQSELDRKAEELAASQSKLVKAQAELADLKTQLTEAESEMAAVKTQLEKAQSDLQSSQENLTDLKADFDSTQQSLEEKTAELSSREQEYEALSQEYETLKQEHESLILESASTESAQLKPFDWSCSACGMINSKKFCTNCGASYSGDSARSVSWFCLDCGKENNKNFCESCGKQRDTGLVGSLVCYGNYEQDNNTENGQEEIEWIVLDDKNGTNLLVISRYALDCQVYNSERTDVTWESCSLRKWLNGTFLNTAFSREEAVGIVTVTVPADKNPKYSTSAGNDTQDKVFLLSITELEKYFSSKSDLACCSTAYAEAQGATVNESGGSCWWLRSPGFGSTYAAGVSLFGSVGYIGYDVYSNAGVRPALWISLAS